MRRALTVLLTIIMLVSLVGCQRTDDAKDASTALDGAQPDQLESESLPDETPEPTPIPDVPIASYTYETEDNQELGVSFKYPSHWISVPGTNTICYEEPVEPGQMSARLSVTRKQAGNIVVTEDVGMDQLTAFAKSLNQQYENFKMKKGKRFKFAGNVGFYFTYTGDYNGAQIKGYAALAYAKGKKNSFYLLHFYTPLDRFASFETVRSTIVKSMKV